MIIKSLTRINEAKDSADEKYKTETDVINKDYEKVLKDTKSWKYTPRVFSKHKVNEAHDKKEDLLDSAELRRKAAKQGMVSKQDFDEAKFEAAKDKHSALVSKLELAKAAKKSISKTVQKGADKPEIDKSTILAKIGKHLNDNSLPYLATAGIAAGIAVALQKRKNRLPEPGSYN